MLVLSTFKINAANLKAVVAENTTAAIHIRLRYSPSDSFIVGRYQEISFRYLGHEAVLEVYPAGTAEHSFSVSANLRIKHCQHASKAGIGGMALVQGDYTPVPGSESPVHYFRPKELRDKDGDTLVSWVNILSTALLRQSRSTNELFLTVWMLPTGDMTEQKTNESITYTWSVMNSCLAIARWSKATLESTKIALAPILSLTASDSTRSKDKYKLSLSMNHQVQDEGAYPYNGVQLFHVDAKKQKTSIKCLPWRSLTSATAIRDISSELDYRTLLQNKPADSHVRLVVEFNRTQTGAAGTGEPAEAKCKSTRPADIKKATLVVTPDGDELLYVCLMHFNQETRERAAFTTSRPSSIPMNAIDIPSVKSDPFNFHDKQYEMEVYHEGDASNLTDVIVAVRPYSEDEGVAETTEERGWENLKGFLLCHHPVLLGPEAKVAPPRFFPFHPGITDQSGNDVVRGAVCPITSLNSIMNHDEFFLRAVHHPKVKDFQDSMAARRPFQSVPPSKNEVTLEVRVHRFDLSWPQSNELIIDPVVHNIEGGKIKLAFQADASGNLKLYLQDIPDRHEYFTVCYLNCCNSKVCSWEERAKLKPGPDRVIQQQAILDLGKLSSILEHSAEIAHFKIKILRTPEQEYPSE